jgi:hypothetical protein
MIYDGEMKHYFGRGKIVPNAQVYSILMVVEGFYIFDTDSGAQCPDPLCEGV